MMELKVKISLDCNLNTGVLHVVLSFIPMHLKLSVSFECSKSARKKRIKKLLKAYLENGLEQLP